MNKYIRIQLLDNDCTVQNAFEDIRLGVLSKQNLLKVSPNPRLKTDVSISQEMVDNFIKDAYVSTIGDKTTMVRVILINGFEIIETSACVDKENYSEKIGGEVCLKKIKDKVWMLLGFLLQSAVGGVSNANIK